MFPRFVLFERYFLQNFTRGARSAEQGIDNLALPFRKSRYLEDVLLHLEFRALHGLSGDVARIDALRELQHRSVHRIVAQTQHLAREARAYFVYFIYGILGEGILTLAVRCIGDSLLYELLHLIPGEHRKHNARRYPLSQSFQMLLEKTFENRKRRKNERGVNVVRDHAKPLQAFNAGFMRLINDYHQSFFTQLPAQFLHDLARVFYVRV